MVRSCILSIIIPALSLCASDLAEVKAKGVLRHIGIPYANFITGSGDGLDVELTQKFAAHLGVKYEYVPSDWGTVVSDLIGKTFQLVNGKVELLEDTPTKGDLVANGFTILPWRTQVITFSTPVFPSQVWLICRADSPVRPIKPTKNIEKDIEKTKSIMKGKSVLSLEKTCLDPALYNLSATGARVISFKGKLNELAPALLKKEAQMTILDVPDALVAMEKWPGKLKIIGPITKKQEMGAGFTKEAKNLAEEYNKFLQKTRQDGTYQKLIKKYYPTVHHFFPEFFKKFQ